MKVFIALVLALFCFGSLSAMDKTLIIVTTDTIRNNSKKLSEFIVEKEKRGFSVLVATEKDYGGAGVKGQEKALLIRTWLQANGNGYSYLLLIGDPNPKYGDVPMVGAYTQGPDGGEFVQFNYTYIATDQLYRDLDDTGDCNENGFFYEFIGDGGYDCASFADTFVTGRIPVYFGDIEVLDKILENTIKYMNQSEQAAQYRKKMLFPMSFIWFKGYTNVGIVKEENRETADVSEWLIHRVLSSQSDYSWTRLYEKEGHVSTKYETDAPLSREATLDYWRQGYGVVFWGGHGQPGGVVRTIWVDDANGDELAQNSETTQIDLLKTGDFEDFSGDTPGFVFALSCLVGDVVPAGNISHDMLANGAAIGVISSTFIDSPSYNTDFEDFESVLSDRDYTIDLIGIHAIEEMVRGEPPAAILSSLRGSIGTDKVSKVFDHKLMMHYYGDPTLTLQEQAVTETPDAEESEADIVPDAETGSTDNSDGCSLLIV